MADRGYGNESGREVSRFVGASLEEAEGGRCIGHAPIGDHLRAAHGGVQTGVLLTLADFVGGLCGGIAALPDGWVVSTNLAGRIVCTEHAGPIRIEAGVLRTGRNNVVTGVQLFDEGAGDALIADGMLTSAILVPENGPPPWERPVRIALTPVVDPPGLHEWLAPRAPDDHTVEIDLADDLRNPWGILHGGVVATLADLATEQVTGGITTDMVLHFLAPNRTGPVRAEARPIATRADGTACRVEVRDTGADRTTAVAIATARPADARPPTARG